MKEHRQNNQQDPIFDAWQTQLKEASKRPWLASILLQRGREIFRRFVHYYQALQSLSRRKRRLLMQKFTVGIGALALAMAINGGPVLAANINVTTTSHGINLDGECSLVEAIITANDTISGDPFGPDCDAGDPIGPDTITLSGNTYNVNYAFDYTYGPTGLPTITSDVTITGNGSVIQGVQPLPRGNGGGGTPFRMMAIASGGDLTINESTIQGGEAPGYGGGIFSYEGNITLENNTVITNNYAPASGGGIFQRNDGALANLTITDSTVSGNFGIVGGGIYNFSIDNVANISLDNSVVSGNYSLGPGGGILNGGYLSSTITINNNSQIVDNTAYYATGGGIANFSFYTADVTIQSSSVISGNQAAIGFVAPLRGDMPQGPGVPPGLAAGGGGILNTNALPPPIIGERPGAADTAVSGITPQFDPSQWPAKEENHARPQAPTGIGLPYEATVTLDNSTISGNTAIGSGGGVHNVAYGFGAIYVENNASITNNQANNSDVPYTIFGNGGGLYNTTFGIPFRPLSSSEAANGLNTPNGPIVPPIGQQATVHVNNSTVSGNTADNDGGGIYNYAYGRAYVTLLNNASVNNNSAYGLSPVPRTTTALHKRHGQNQPLTISGEPLATGLGGGIMNNSFFAPSPPPLKESAEDSSNRIAGSPPLLGFSQLFIDNSTISGNTSNFTGGGAANHSFGLAYSNVQNNSEINNNTTIFGSGGGLSTYGYANYAYTSVDESAVSRNQAQLEGGGIDNYSYLGGTGMVINKSTISGNVAGYGGGVYNGSYGAPTYATLNNSTISGNSAVNHGGGIDNHDGTATLYHTTVTNNSAPDGGGIYSSNTVNLFNSIVAANPSGGDCSGTIASGGYNLDSDGSCITDGVNNDITAADPLLGPLQLNAPGNTETHGLLAGSPAFDAIPGDSDACGLLPDDQRGISRPQGADACDIGAFERQVFNTFLPIIMNNPTADLVVTDLNVVDGNLSVTIENQGTRTVTEDFWVDLYLNPSPPPTAVNDVWDFLGPYGVAWGVTENLSPGESLTLTLNDTYYDATESNMPAIIPAGTVIYAQVDAAHLNTNFGAVLEDHEINGDTYNNIAGPETTNSPITASILNFVSRIKSWVGS